MPLYGLTYLIWEDHTMKYAIKQFPMGKKIYWVIFDDQNDTSSHLFASREEAKEALEAERGKPASKIDLQGRA